MIYLDNSSSSFIKPKSVQRAVANALTTFTANPGRAGHKMAIKTAMEVDDVDYRNVIDMSYYERLASEAIADISVYGDFDWFAR